MKSKSSKVKSQRLNLLLWLGATFIIIITLANFYLWGRNSLANWQREPIQKEIKEWEEVVRETPTYRDGHLKLATLYWKINEDQKAKEAINKAKEIDPNYEPTYKLEEKLGY